MAEYGKDAKLKNLIYKLEKLHDALRDKKHDLESPDKMKDLSIMMDHVENLARGLINHADITKKPKPQSPRVTRSPSPVMSRDERMVEVYDDMTFNNW